MTAGYPTRYYPTADFSGAWHTDWSHADPNFLVASIASPISPKNPAASGYSTDGGLTWTPFPTIPLGSTNGQTTFGYGSLAVSGTNDILWCPAYGHRPHYSNDRGATWNPITLPGVGDYSVINSQAFYVTRIPNAADKVTTGTFYLLVMGVGIFRSTDAGVTWTQRCTTSQFGGTGWTWHAKLLPVPGKAGHLILVPGPLNNSDTSWDTATPCRYSTDGGLTWTALSSASAPKGCGAVAWGAPATTGGYPTLYAIGWHSGTYGLHRSADAGTTWTLLLDDIMEPVTAMAASKDTYGEVVIASGSVGWIHVTAP